MSNLIENANRFLYSESKYIISVKSPKEIRSKRVFKEIEKYLLKGVRSKDIKLSVDYIDDGKSLKDFKVVKNKVAFELHKNPNNDYSPKGT